MTIVKEIRVKKKLQLYLHIPFCIKKCDYCDFLSFPLGAKEWPEGEILSGAPGVNPSLTLGQTLAVNEKVKSQYIRALESEIKNAKDKFKDYEVSTIFMGGGTPSILSCEEMIAIFTALKETFEIDNEVEITIEANPGTVTEDKVATWKKVGINRVSIGLQSANDEELKWLGRVHTFGQFKESFLLLRENGFSNINVDLISGVPGQTIKSYMETLNQVIECNPEHISAYGLMIEEGTTFAENLYPALPSEETERLMYKVTKEQLEQQGYHRYEISNYAKEGFECRHNLGYWERADYLGLGLGAASLFENTRFHQVKDLEQYVELFTHGKACQPEEVLILDEKEQMEEFMFLGLRKTKGISIAKFNDKFSRKMDEVYGHVLLKLEKESFIENNGDEIKLTEKGIDISNVILSEFIF